MYRVVIITRYDSKFCSITTTRRATVGRRRTAAYTTHAIFANGNPVRHLIDFNTSLHYDLSFREQSNCDDDLLKFEDGLFRNSAAPVKENVAKEGIKRIKYRLLREFVRDDYPVSKECVMQVGVFLTYRMGEKRTIVGTCL
jgi:hypothetical protein